MLNNVYRLVAPRTFEPVQVPVALTGAEVLVRPTHLSICNADMRYYLGARPAEVLARKLPMALIHEGIGTVVSDATNTFAPGAQVVMLPNQAIEQDDCIGENYLPTSKFSGSGFDGFMCEYAVLPPERVVALPEGVEPYVAAFTELVSVAMHAVSRFQSIAHARRESIGVWGDGNLGFIVGLVLRMCLPEAKVYVVGRAIHKLGDFTYADGTFLTTQVNRMPAIDHAFECCGGDGAAEAINQIIDTIRPEGTVSLLGVSENRVPINTRDVLEKGLRLFGSSRSSRADFEAVAEMYTEHPESLRYLEALVGDVIQVHGVADMAAAFEADLRKPMGKTIMHWGV